MKFIIRTKGLFLVAFVTILLALEYTTTTTAFAPPRLPSTRFLVKPKAAAPAVARRHDISSSRLYFFFGKKEEKEKDQSTEDTDDEEKKNGDKQKDRSRFLGGLLGRGEAKSKEEGSDEQEPKDSSGTATAIAERPAFSSTTKHELTPQEQAASLRAQAERARLEAERMDAELTLEKIARLEKELAKARKKEEPVDDLLQEMEALRAKMRGEPPTPKVAPKKDDKSSSSRSTKSPPPPVSLSVNTLTPPPKAPTSDQPVDQERFESILEAFQDIPDFLKMILAKSLDMSPDNVNDINATEVALRLDQLDASFMVNGTYPVSDEEVQAMKKNPLFPLSKAAMGEEAAGLSDDEVARRVLAKNYYSDKMTEALTKNYLDRLMVDDAESGFMEGLQLALNRTEVDVLTESLFPPCTRKEGQSPSEADALALVTDVLPKASFMPSGKPEPVAGGFLVRGTSKLKSNDATIEAIDAALEKSSLNGKLSVFLINDYTILTEENMESPAWALTGNEPILMVLGPDISRERRRLLFSAVTAAGIASSWYLSIYPFLLNADIMKRAEEQMSLADSGMVYDLSWLTDMSLPLFGTFIGIHLIHELGHRLAAAAYKMELTVPTLVPSLITGITSAVTSFKTPPKNKQAMFDFAIAGPLAGMTASAVALYFGCQFTAFTDPQSYAMFPALPLEILRQSTLGGGVIEYVLGSGSLGVPDAALGSSAVASISIPLHPIAIAGYIGLIVNALALLPIGTTDGGRIALTLFSRGAKLVVGQIFMLALLVAGILGSDLFLFYFSFCVFFQQGNEIPARNEADEIDFGRILLSTVAGVVSLLALIPFS